MFSKASWLERIHHNGGRPIYAGISTESAPRRPAMRRREEKPPAAPTHAPVPAATESPPEAKPAAASPVPAPAPAAAAGDLDALLAKAKAYRPLAQHLLAKIRQVSPGASLGLRDSALAIGAPAPFALLAISHKELRLHLALGDHPFDEALKKGQAGAGLGKGEALSHMLVLTDARQVDARLMDLVALAAARVSG
jgi:hypothetical protein